MVKKPNQPAETAEPKKQIETIVGHEIDPDVKRLIKFSYPAGSYTAFGEVLPSESHVCWRRIYPFPSKVCSFGVPLLDATGVSSTLADGKRVFHVSDVVCPQGAFFGFGEPINVVATPLAEFTLPAAIADIAYQNKAAIYDILFTASAETMITIAADPKHLGARGPAPAGKSSVYTRPIVIRRPRCRRPARSCAHGDGVSSPIPRCEAPR
jgi:hypothetical protein